MQEPDSSEANTSQPEPDAIALSNGIRLTSREWIGLGLFAVVIVIFTPSLWRRAEKFALEPDYRLPHDLSNDYWLFGCFAGLAADHDDTLLIGDSVVWGEYVNRQETLSHYLNALAGQNRFANLGLDGAHPLALGGLIEFHAERISGKNVVLQCNPLWMSSARADLQDYRTDDFNHPRLVPQFAPSVPAYKAEISPRLGVLVERWLPLGTWTAHLQQAYYDRVDIPGWTLEHPYDNPLAPLMRGLPPSENSRRHVVQPWFKSGIVKQDYPWIDLETSLQWRAFQGVVELLQQRGNRVFVLVGPFNEHLLTPASLKRYERVNATIADWLRKKKIPYMVPPPLPSEQYGDASHPLAVGYEELARQLAKDPFFRAR
jgi:DNA-binding transcriptional regulator of glucitol operon